jgi:zinc/manganese transport system substrate-binding protein
VTTILNSPSADPHAYEPTTRDADAIGAADIVIENGLGYDAFADKVIAATPRRGRIVIDVGAERHHIGDNPHVWYDMPTVRLFTNAFALALAEHLDKATGDAEGPALVTRALAIQSWANATQHRLALLGAKHRGALVAITEPVFDYVLDAAAVKIATPPSFSHAIEEGNDPAPQDVDAMQAMLAHKSVAAFVYNTQTVEPATQRLLATAKAANVAVVPVTETLPQNLTTQHWIDGEIDALDRAL